MSGVEAQVAEPCSQKVTASTWPGGSGGWGVWRGVGADHHTSAESSRAVVPTSEAQSRAGSRLF